jgi:succinate dehydrogenase / fumarate reductase cytochrome b subunit
MNDNKQPLSPHLSVYRWQITNTLSILHRLSGLVLFLAAFDFAIWLGSIALGGDAYAGVSRIFSTNILLIIWALVSLSFFYHLLNGIRHLLWDIGKGFEASHVKLTGLLVVFFSVIITALFWYCLLTKYG